VTQTSVAVVVAGSGAAGHSSAATLRKEGYTGALTVLHPEPHAPYNRTLVNKAVLQGLLTAEQIALPPLDALGVEVVHAAVGAIDGDSSVLVLNDGRRLPYTALVAATGSRPRTGDLPATGSGRLLGVHTVADATRIHGWFGGDPGSMTVTLLGAGFIGAETASYLAGTGATVHLISRAAVPLVPALGGRIARRVAELHHQHVTTHFGRQVVTVTVAQDSVTVTLDDGERVESDLAVVAYGTAPSSDWATGTGDGIVVDDRLRAVALPRVYAAGSVAVHTARTGQRYRVDHWDAAVSQGAHAARTLLHDLQNSEDPGTYVPNTGFTLILYRQAIAAFGVALPAAIERQHPTGDANGILTTFHEPTSHATTAAAGLGAARELLALRGQLERP
jgi:3-phenylpropionate/trans-cinnamate dioxygenase ferredoxin reductase component